MSPNRDSRGANMKIASLLQQGTPGLSKMQSVNGHTGLKDFAPPAGQLFQKMGNNIIQGGSCGGVYDMSSIMQQKCGKLLHSS